MTGPRTVTVPTLDHGPVTMPEPAWCAGHTGQGPEYRADLHHAGPEQLLVFRDEPLWLAQFVQYPYGTGPRETGLYVTDTGFARTLDPADLLGLAAALAEHTAELRTLAVRLAHLRGDAR
ncbi:DUF6907 domain-containing protein [Streptomyces sp. NPDC054854]